MPEPHPNTTTPTAADAAPRTGKATNAAAAAPSPLRMPLPRGAIDALNRQGLWLELHIISYSHYCARAKWYLASCGLKADAVRLLLPVQHVPHMISMLKEFKAARCAPTASSKSPAATPALAIYAAEESDGNNNNKRRRGAPLCLLQDSELIGRWAALRAGRSVGDSGAAARRLYGPGARLSVVEEEEGEEDGRRRAFAVLSYDDDAAASDNNDNNTTNPALLERRLSGTLGVESRRLIYYHLLPRPDLGVRLFVRNVPPGPGLMRAWSRFVAAPLWAGASSLLLPRLLNVNRASVVDKGLPLLEAELDALDAMVVARGCLAGGGGGKDGEEDRVGAFLCGGGKNDGPSAADISLAALGGIVAGDLGEGAYGAQLPALEELPAALRELLTSRFVARPSMRFARALWREHGAAAVAAAVAGAEVA